MKQITSQDFAKFETKSLIQPFEGGLLPSWRMEDSKQESILLSSYKICIIDFAKFSITILEELSPFRRRSVVVHVLCMQPRLVDTIAESCFHLASLQVDD